MTWSDEYQMTVGITVQIILLALVIVQLLTLHDHWLWRRLDHPILGYIGLISYPMYLYHQLGAAIGRYFMLGSPRWVFVIELVATIAMGKASYYLAERPFLRLKDRLTRHRRRAAVAAPAGSRATAAA